MEENYRLLPDDGVYGFNVRATKQRAKQHTGPTGTRSGQPRILAERTDN